MPHLRTLLLMLCLVHLVSLGYSLDNGLARLPPMGWMTGQRFGCNTDCQNYPDDCISDHLVRSTVDAMVSGGYVQAGYRYVLVGDCWMAKTRDGQNRLQPDPQRFPKGIKDLANYVQSKGMKFGLYLATGNTTANGYPGSENHLSTDAQTLAQWQVDLLRLDGCNTKDAKTYDQVYPEMGANLNKTGRHILYFCDWPIYSRKAGITPDYGKISKTCNMYHPYQTLQDSWTDLEAVIKWYGQNWQQFFNYTHPGSWNFPGQLAVGGYGLSQNEAEMQIAIWSVMAAPIMVSVDLRKVAPHYKSVLLNAGAIAINQDPLGVMGYQHLVSGQVKVWLRPIYPKGSYALALIYTNISGGPSKVSLKLTDLNVLTAAAYNITDIYSGQHMGTYKPWYTLDIEVNPTGVRFLRAYAIG